MFQINLKIFKNVLRLGRRFQRHPREYKVNSTPSRNSTQPEHDGGGHVRAGAAQRQGGRGQSQRQVPGPAAGPVGGHGALQVVGGRTGLLKLNTQNTILLISHFRSKVDHEVFFVLLTFTKYFG